MNPGRRWSITVIRDHRSCLVTGPYGRVEYTFQAGHAVSITVARSFAPVQARLERS
jgi:hypothetical protein